MHHGAHGVHAAQDPARHTLRLGGRLLARGFSSASAALALVALRSLRVEMAGDRGGWVCAADGLHYATCCYMLLRCTLCEMATFFLTLPKTLKVSVERRGV